MEVHNCALISGLLAQMRTTTYLMCVGGGGSYGLQHLKFLVDVVILISAHLFLMIHILK
jgi:hypothetical protein